MRRIGVLMGFAENDAEGHARLGALREGLDKLGWSDGRNLQLDARWAAGNLDQLRKNAADLVGKNPEVIVVSGSTALQAVQRETLTVPIVFANAADPVADGFVASLARPGGNITGYTNFEEAITGKWLEILSEVAGNVTQVLVLYYPENKAAPGQLRTLRTLGLSLNVQLIFAGVRGDTEIEDAINGFAPHDNGGLIVLPDANIGVHRQKVIQMTAHHKLPAIYPLRYFVADGGLMSYGADPYDLFRQSASYVDRILRGQQPGELPVQTPTKFELVINLKTAKALGLTIPESFLLRADEVIE